MRRWAPALIALVGLLAIVGWKVTQKKAEAADQVSQKAARGKAPLSVETATVTRKDVSITIEEIGTVEAPLAADVSSRLTARLLSLTVREGDRVGAGDILGRLDPVDVNSAIARAEAAVAQARARLAEGKFSRNPADVDINSARRREQAGVIAAIVARDKSLTDSAQNLAIAEADVVDAQGRIDLAQSNIDGARASVRTAQANVDNARQRLQRATALKNEGAAAQQFVDDAQTTLSIQEAARAEADERVAAAIAAKSSAEAQKAAAEKRVDLGRTAGKNSQAAATAALKQAQAALSSASAAKGRSAAFAENLAALEAAVKVADADLLAARARAQDLTLRAPFTGVIVRRFVDPGALASPSQAIVSIQSLDRVRVVTPVPEEAVTKIAVGASVPVNFDALPGEPRSGIVEQILPAADTQSRQVIVRILVDNRDSRLRPGMFARAKFTLRSQNGSFYVPREALIRGDKDAVSVALADGDVAKLVPVTILLEDDNGAAVSGALKEGARVIVLSSRDIKDGQKLRTGERKTGDGEKPASGKTEAAK